MFNGNVHASCFFFTFLLVINRVSSQNVRVVNGALGGTVILPCSTSQSNTNVYWRYGEKTTVCDIIAGEVDFEEQDPVYKDRVESFPAEFAKGNFSIKLKKLKKSDEGIYTCNFPRILTPETLKLIVTENRSGIVLRGPDSLVLFLLGCILLSN